MSRSLLPCHLFVALLVVCVAVASVQAQPWPSTASLLTTASISNTTLMPSVSNGYVGTFIFSDTIYVSGLFNGVNISPSHRARIPSTVNITVSSATPRSSASSCISGFALNLTSASFVQRSCFGLATIDQVSYAHQVRRSLMVVEVTADNTAGQEDLTLNFQLLSGPASPDITFKLLQTANGISAFNGTINQPEEPGGQVVHVGLAVTQFAPSAVVKRGTSSKFTFLTTIRTSITGDSQFPAVDAVVDIKDALLNQDSLYSTHVQEWESIWANAGIEIEGDLNLAQVINSSLYYIISSARADWPWSLSPGSLASNGYNGHTFWDCETWMYPAVLLLDHVLAGSLLEYRVNHRAGAALKARSYNNCSSTATTGSPGGNCGYIGTMFPWESAFTGLEVCPFRGGTCWYEQHITGDVAFAAWQFWAATGNYQWMSKIGYPLLYDIATFWESRVKLQDGYYVIDGVIPPDEYHSDVNNSVFTNAVAKMSLEYATTYGAMLGIETPDSWVTIANNIKIPFDQTRQIHLEYDGYTNDTIKQADVILLGFPLMYNMTRQIRYNDLEFYSSVTDPDGPAMTWSMTAIGYLEYVQTNQSALQKANSYFGLSYANAQLPFQVWTETPTGGTVNFITGVGGFLQGVMFGYGGIRLLEHQMTFTPILPPGTSSMKIRMLDFLGSQLNVSFNSTTFTITLQQQGDIPLQFVANGGTSYSLKQGVGVSVPIAAGMVLQAAS